MKNPLKELLREALADARSQKGKGMSAKEMLRMFQAMMIMQEALKPKDEKKEEKKKKFNALEVMGAAALFEIVFVFGFTTAWVFYLVK